MLNIFTKRNNKIITDRKPFPILFRQYIEIEFDELAPVY